MVDIQCIFLDILMIYLGCQSEDAGNGPEWGVINIEVQSHLQGQKCHYLSTYITVTMVTIISQTT